MASYIKYNVLNNGQCPQLRTVLSDLISYDLKMANIKKDKSARDGKRPRHHKYSLDEKKFLRDIGLKLQQEIRANGSTIESFCFDHNIPRSGLSELIAGRRDPQLITLRRIVQKMGYKDLTDFLITL